MNGLQPLLAFSETAKHGGFAAAAREIGGTPSTIAKAVGRLEATLGLRLFHRTTRQVQLTADGERLFQRCQRVLAELEELQSEAAGARATPSGTLRLSLPLTYGRTVVLPILARLREAHPAMQLDVRLSDVYVDLVKEGYDLAVRVGALDDSSLVARRIDSQALVLVASPDYLRRHGTPRAPEELSAHRNLLFRLPGRGRDLPQRFSAKGRIVTLLHEQADRIDDGDTLVLAAAQGLGLVQVPDYMAASQLADGSLVEVMRDWRPPDMPIHAVMPGQRLMPARVRVLLDALAELRRQPAQKAVSSLRRPRSASGRPAARNA